MNLVRRVAISSALVTLMAGSLSAPTWAKTVGHKAATHAAHGLNSPLANDSPYMVLTATTLPVPEWKQDYKTVFEQMGRLGLSWAYVYITWSDIEKVPGQYDFSGMDQLVADAHLHGIQLMMQVQAEGQWTVPGPAQDVANGGYRTNTSLPVAGWPVPYTAAPMNIDAPIPFWKALVKHYHPGGELAQSQGWQDSYGILYYEVENEPDSFPWPGGNWQRVPHDYALYLNHLAPVLHTIDPGVRVLAPALSTGPDTTDCVVPPPTGCPFPGWPGDGSQFLNRVVDATPSAANLSWASDQYRAAIAGGDKLVGAGPSIDVYSFHWDFSDPSTDYGPQRAQQLQQVVASHLNDPAFPTRADAQFWDSEGGPTAVGTNDPAGAFREAQVGLEMLGAGVSRVCWQPPSNTLSPSDPFTQMTLALTSFFPSGHGVSTVTSQISAIAGQHVDAYQWTNPATGLKSLGLWAQDEPNGSGTTGPAFTVNVPVSTPYAIVTGADWSRHLVAASGGTVPVTLGRADPSPVTLVVESNGPVTPQYQTGPIHYDNTPDYNAPPYPLNVGPPTPNLSITGYTLSGSAGTANVMLTLQSAPAISAGGDSTYYLVTWVTAGTTYYAGYILRLLPVLGPSASFETGVLALDSNSNPTLAPDTSAKVTGVVAGNSIRWSIPYGKEAAAGMPIDQTAAFSRIALDWTGVFPPSFVGGDQAPEDSVMGQDEGPGGKPFS